MGEITNTDAQYLAEQLSALGINVYHQSVVGDNKKRLSEEIKRALERSDIVITSGGLGPTPDDLTKETLAECMGEKLVLHEESLKRMKDYFRSIGRAMTENNVKQAMLPEHCIVLKNTCGTAPGCIIEKDGKAALMLPGPPVELKAMFEGEALEYLRKKSDKLIYSRIYRIFGMGESAVAQNLADLMRESTNPTVAPYAKTGEVHLRVAASCDDEAEGERLIDSVKGRIYEAAGEYIYSDDGKDLYDTTAELLLRQGLTISAAESCTGGLFAKTLTDIAGISEVFKESFVTYSNEAKMKYLGVSAETLDKHGAVSAETAAEMAEGLKQNTGADIAVGITGIAGPGGGTEEKPVGLVYVGLAAFGRTEVKKLTLNGSRARIRTLAVMNTFDMIRRAVLANEQGDRQ